MKIWLHLGLLRHCLDHVCGHVGGVGRSEPNPGNAIHRGYHSEQLAKSDLIVTISVYRLAEQDDLFGPAFRQTLNFAQDGREGDTAFASSNVRHYTERTKLVAAPHDRDISPHTRIICGRDITVSLGAVQPHVDGRITGYAGKQFR